MAGLPIMRWAWVAVAVLVAVTQPTAQAEFRHALVIGQSTYKTGTLAAAPKDVATVADALVRAGFTVTRLENVPTAAKLDEAVTAFSKTIPTDGTALVYFSGHAAAVPAVTGTNPPRRDTALLAIDGGRHPLTAVLRPLVMAPYGPRNGVPKSFPCGSRINVVVIDAGPPPFPPVPPGQSPPAPSPSGPDSLPPLDTPPDTLVVLRPAGAAVPAADAAGPSPLAERLVAGLAAGKTLDVVLTGNAGTTMSSIAPADLARLKAPASQAASLPDTLAPGPKPGAEWVDRNGMVFCWCPPGEFTIGSPATEPERQRDEIPAVVSFAGGFWMAKHEICYRESLPLGGQDNSSTGSHKLLPLNATSPGHAAAIIAAAGAAAPAGWEYGLPTEAEWEYAARAGSKAAYAFGDSPADLARHGNFADRTLRESQSFGERVKWNPPRSETPAYFGDRQTGVYSYAHPTWNDAHVGPARIASYLPNAWGLCDMHGNVSEMTSTVYSANRIAPVVAPEQYAAWAARPENRAVAFRGYVCKGGSWASTSGYSRAAFRGWMSVKDSMIGLRLVLRKKGAAVPPPATKWTPLVPTAVVTTSGATAAASPDGSVLVSGTTVAGDSYTITCPVPAGIEPLAVKLEPLTDPTLPKQGPGRYPDGQYWLSEVSIAGIRGGQPAAIMPLGVKADLPQPPPGYLLDGKPDTFWGGVGDGKNHELVITVGLPSRTGYDSARWRYPIESVSQGPLSSLTVTIAHRKDIPAPLGRFRISVLHEEPTP